MHAVDVWVDPFEVLLRTSRSEALPELPDYISYRHSGGVFVFGLSMLREHEMFENVLCRPLLVLQDSWWW